MSRRHLAFLAVLALAASIPSLFRIRPAPLSAPADARDAVADWRDLASIHERSAGAQACGWCHREPGHERAPASDPSRWIASAAPAAARSESVASRVCLSCHDGLLARSGSYDRDADHPIGVDYRAALRKAPAQFNDPAFRTEIRLDDGTVGCVSCHLGHGRNGRLGGPAGVTVDGCSVCHNK